MSGLFDSLILAGNSIQVQQFGAQTISNNISNLNTEGYHREDTIIQSGINQSQFATVSRAANIALESNANQQAGNAAFADSRALRLSNIQKITGDLSSNSLGNSLASFFSGWRNLSTNPQDLGLRTDLMSRAQTLVSTIQNNANNLTNAQTQADSQVVEELSQINTWIASVAQYNIAITSAESSGGVASSFRDERDYLLTQLSSTIGATYAYAPDGQVSVYVGGGVSVVSGSASYSLQASINGANGLHNIVVSGTSQGALDSRITSGSVGAYLTLRDQDVPALQQQLNQFAYDLVEAVNTVHTANYDLNGAIGADFFLNPNNAVSGAASVIGVNSTIFNNPSLVAAAGGFGVGPVGLSGDARGALAMVSMESQNVANSNTQTLGQSVAQLISTLGSKTAQANIEQTQQDAYLQQAHNLVQTQIGFSLEEQLMQLSLFFNAFKASTHVVNTINGMFDSLMSIT